MVVQQLGLSNFTAVDLGLIPGPGIKIPQVIWCAMHGTTDWFQIGKGVRQGCILSPCLFNFYAEYIMRNAGLEKHKVESRLPGEISITSDMPMIPPLMAESEELNKRASGRG